MPAHARMVARAWAGILEIPDEDAVLVAYGDYVILAALFDRICPIVARVSCNRFDSALFCHVGHVLFSV
jgi:hypothetical protein